MKMNKYFKYWAFSLFFVVSLVSCSDDETVEAPRLFRPVTTLSSTGNNIEVDWDNIKGATSYEIKLYQIINGEDAILPNQEPILTETATSAPFVFSNIEWDEKYAVRIKSVGSGIESKEYESESLLVPKPTSLNNIDRIIDNAALITWKETDILYTTLIATPTAKKAADGTIIEGAELGDPVKVTVSEADRNVLQKIVSGLQPLTTYKIAAYSGDVQDQSTYQGRTTFSTKAAVNYDEKYGEGNYIDIRTMEDEEASKIINKDFLNGLAPGTYIILKGGFEYSLATLEVAQDVNFITGLSLAGNAFFIQDGPIKNASGTAPNITFESIDFKSTKVDSEEWVNNQTGKDFGGKQVININSGTLGNISFKDCNITGYRAVVRMQADNDAIASVMMNGCTVNGIGDQGMITNSGKKATIGKVTIQNSTLMNIVLIADLRNAATSTLDVTDCTTCYTPWSSTANPNTPMFRLSKSSVALSITRTIIGPAMENIGNATVATYTASSVGSILLDDATISVDVKESYKTNFVYTVINEKEYPLPNLEDTKNSETDLFTDPTNGVFKLKKALTAGAQKWRME